MRKIEKWLIGISAAVFGLLSLQPIFLDPYYHEEKVCFWEWLAREIDELVHGERNNEQKKEYVYT